LLYEAASHPYLSQTGRSGRYVADCTEEDVSGSSAEVSRRGLGVRLECAKAVETMLAEKLLRCSDPYSHKKLGSYTCRKTKGRWRKARPGFG